MELKVTKENGRVPVTVIHVDGNIDASTSEIFREKADQLIQNGAHYLLVDLTHVPFVSSAGLRVFHELFNKLRALQPAANLSDEEIKQGISAATYKSPHIKLLNLSKATRQTFETSGFDMYIETYTDIKTALASF
jgi:anti-sigma B factor antagonist